VLLSKEKKEAIRENQKKVRKQRRAKGSKEKQRGAKRSKGEQTRDSRTHCQGVFQANHHNRECQDS